jgi:hypothetical protein|tara:strand:- start:273 stop:401 length:129 start_codon:yes stop_codon:yes gene_type:complete
MSPLQPALGDPPPLDDPPGEAPSPAAVVLVELLGTHCPPEQL